jgi:hypothetical protein
VVDQILDLDMEHLSEKLQDLHLAHLEGKERHFEVHIRDIDVDSMNPTKTYTQLLINFMILKNL